MCLLYGVSCLLPGMTTSGSTNYWFMLVYAAWWLHLRPSWELWEYRTTSRLIIPSEVEHQCMTLKLNISRKQQMCHMYIYIYILAGSLARRQRLLSQTFKLTWRGSLRKSLRILDLLFFAWLWELTTHWTVGVGYICRSESPFITVVTYCILVDN